MQVSNQRPQNWHALYHDRASNLGGIPDVRHCIPPEVPLIFLVAIVFPAGPDGTLNGHDHTLRIVSGHSVKALLRFSLSLTQAHCDTKPDFLFLRHVQVPGDDPGERREHEVHKNVVHCE